MAIGVPMTKIYALSDPRTSRVRYVGATARALSIRLAGHLRKPSNKGLRRWFDELRAAGLRPVISELPREFLNWQDDERGWIAHFRLWPGMLNVDPGGICRHRGRLFGNVAPPKKKRRRQRPSVRRPRPDPCGDYLRRKRPRPEGVYAGPVIRRRSTG